MHNGSNGNGRGNQPASRLSNLNLGTTLVRPNDPLPSAEPIFDSVTKFEQLWKDGRFPDLRAFVDEQCVVAANELLQLVKIDQQFRWQRGEQPPAEVYLAAFPQLQLGPQAFALVVAEARLQKKCGRKPRALEFQQRFPRYSKALAHHPVFADTQQKSPIDIPTQIRTEPPGSSKPPRAHRASPIPDVAGYKILKVLGRGGMGVVYKAWHYGLRRDVALKMMLFGEFAWLDDIHRLLNEATAVAKLQHPGIVQIFDIGEHGGLPHYSMEYVGGGTLADRLDGSPQMPKTAASLIAALARAIHHAHQQGIIHRDLKPANVLLTGGPELALENCTAKITDFGIAKNAEAAGLTCPGTILGTPSYMAPEQAEDSQLVVATSDVYALGAILYEMLTGKPPFHGLSPTDTLLLVRHDNPKPPRSLQRTIPADLETICLKCLEKNPARRYDTARELAEDLHRFLNGEPITARPVSAIERSVKWARRRPGIASLSVSLILLAVASFVLLAGFWRTAEHKALLAELAQQEEKKARTQAEKAREETLQAKRDVERYLAKTTFDLGMTMAEKGNIISGLLLLNQSLERLTRAEPRGSSLQGLKTIMRKNLTAWQYHVFACRAKLQHDDWVTDVAFSTDSKTAFTCGTDKSIKLWDVASGRLLGKPLETKTAIWSIATNATGWLAAGAGPQEFHREKSNAGAVYFWRLPENNDESPKKIATIEHPLTVERVVFSADGQRLLSQCADGVVRVWRHVTVDRDDRWLLVGRPLIHPAPVLAAEFSPDGKLVLTGCVDGGARLWHAESGALLGLPLNHHAAVSAVAFSPSGDLFATGTSAGETENYETQNAANAVRLWRTKTALRLGPKMEHAGPIKVIRFSPDGRILAAGGIVLTANENEFKGEVRLFQAAKIDFSPPPGTQLLATWAHPKPVWDLAFNPNGRLILTGCEDRRSRLFHVATGYQIGNALLHEGTVSNVAFSRCGQSALSASRCEHGAARLCSVPPGAVDANRLDFPDYPRAAAFDRKGKYAVIACDRKGTFLMDYRSKKLVRFFDTKNEDPHCVAFSPDGNSITVGTDKGKVYLFHIPTNERTVYDQSQTIMQINWAEDGRHIFFRNNSKSNSIVMLTKNGQRKCELKSARVGARIVTMRNSPRPNGLRFIAKDKTTLTVWEWSYMRDELRQLWKADGEIFTPHLSPNGKIILARDATITSRFLDAETGRQLGNGFILPAKLDRVSFSSDNKLVVFTDEFGKIRLWDVDTCKPLGGFLLTADHHVPLVRIHPSGKSLLALNSDCKGYVWEIPQQLRIAEHQLHDWVVWRAAARLGQQNVVRDLRAAERQELAGRLANIGNPFAPAAWSELPPSPIETKLAHRRRHILN